MEGPCATGPPTGMENLDIINLHGLSYFSERGSLSLRVICLAVKFFPKKIAVVTHVHMHLTYLINLQV